WRHALTILGCGNIKVLGLHIESSGGDGIYIGRSGVYGTTKGKHPQSYSKNITIQNVVLDDNYRQGISVISVDWLLMDNVVMSNTGGTRPMAGIDFEPNRSDERLTNIVLRNCVTKNNKGGGYDIELSVPTSMRFENCRSLNDS